MSWTKIRMIEGIEYRVSRDIEDVQQVCINALASGSWVHINPANQGPVALNPAYIVYLEALSSTPNE